MSSPDLPDPRIAFFNQHAANWDTENPPIDQTLRRLEGLRSLLAIEPGQELMEVGCGTGMVTGWLAERVWPGRVTAVDFSPQMLEQARSRGVAADFRDWDVCTADIGQEAYDVILCLNAFPHFRDQVAALANFRRALRDSGRLIVMHLDSWKAINDFHAHAGGAVQHDMLPEPSAWPELLKGVGLEQSTCVDEPDLFYILARPE